MCHFKQIHFGLKKHNLLGIGGPKMIRNDPKLTAVVVTKGGGSVYLVLAAVIMNGISGGKYYWYERAEILLVLAAVIITGISGRRYYSVV